MSIPALALWSGRALSIHDNPKIGRSTRSGTRFDLDAADVINCSRVEIQNVKLNYTQTCNPYFVKKHLVAEKDG